MKPPVSAVVARLVTLLLLSAALSMARESFAQTDVHLGKWSLSVGKSVYQPGPPPRDQIRIYSRDGVGLKAVIETVQPLGAKTRVEYTARFDGQDYPISGNSEVDTIALTRVDEWTFDAILKRRGKVMTTIRNTVSKDGRTMTVRAKGVTARGQATSSVAIFTRQ